jgi:16S rRNA (cytosine967-C5)-methyltransferase
MSSRRDAIFVVARWLETRDFPDRMIPDGPDRAFVTDLVYTTIRRYRTLDWVVRKLVSKMPEGETAAALLVGACQILFMPDVVDYAAVNETVEATKLTARSTAGFVNGVLRNLLRKKDELLAELAKESVGIRLSHPDSLVTRWEERFGTEETKALCEWDNQPAEVFLAYPPSAPEAFVALPKGKRVEEMPGYAEGAFIVQDPATAAAISLLDVKPGQRVLDACAAPGGKTVQIAWRMGTPKDDHQALVAVDLYDDRLATVRANLERARLPWVTVKQADVTDAKALAELGLFDRILLDAPCSNSGVLRRRPDARWRWTTKRMRALAQTQYAMLECLLPLLAPDGKLVYSTCSLEHDENRRQITVLRKAHPELVCTGVEERIPTRSKTDGAFAAVLERAPQA